MLLHVTETSNEPLYEQISQQIIQRILDGDLDSGRPLVPAGIMARQHRVSKNTIKLAYHLLEEKGLIQSDHGQNYYVAPLSAEKIAILKKNFRESRFQKTQNHQTHLDEELTMARQIQFDLLPKELPQTDTLEVAAYTEPSQTIGGDFYDCFRLDENRLVFVIADASGHGLPSALIISQIQAIIKFSLGRIDAIEHLLTLLNKHLKENTSAKNFVTLIYGIYQHHTGRFDYANAGHHMPILVHQNGSIEFLETTAPALGLTAKFEPEIRSAYLRKGEELIFYTDGITETMNQHQTEYGEGRLINTLIQNHALNPNKLVQLIKEDLQKFNAGENPQDDQTLLILKRK